MSPEKVKDNLIVQLSFSFGLDTMLFCDKLFEQKKFVIANQLLRSALSIGANVRESQNAESTADFIHKLRIAAKEGDESEFYLLLIEKAYGYQEVQPLLKNIASINRVLTKIIITTRTTQKSSKPINKKP
jgi:four helix bundle protein